MSSTPPKDPDRLRAWRLRRLRKRQQRFDDASFLLMRELYESITSFKGPVPGLEDKRDPMEKLLHTELEDWRTATSEAQSAVREPPSVVRLMRLHDALVDTAPRARKGRR